MALLSAAWVRGTRYAASTACGPGGQPQAPGQAEALLCLRRQKLVHRLHGIRDHSQAGLAQPEVQRRSSGSCVPPRPAQAQAHIPAPTCSCASSFLNLYLNRSASYCSSHLRSSSVRQ
jgi:hypothetical protein